IVSGKTTVNASLPQREIGREAASSCKGENLRSIIDQLGEGIRRSYLKTAGKAPIQLELERVINGVCAVIADCHWTTGGNFAQPGGGVDRIELIVGKQMFAARSDITQGQTKVRAQLAFDVKVPLENLGLH